MPVFYNQSGVFLMVNRIIFDRSQLSVSEPGVDVHVAPQFSLSLDGTAAAGKIWMKGTINISPWNGKIEFLETVDTIWFGKTFPSPPLFCFYEDNCIFTGWGDRFQDGMVRKDHREWYSCIDVKAYNDRIEYVQYADWYEDLLFDSPLHYTIWDHPC